MALSGGVAANSELRRRAAGLPGITTFVPPRSHCTDNAAMIAFAGRERLVRGGADDLAIAARPSWSMI